MSEGRIEASYFVCYIWEDGKLLGRDLEGEFLELTREDIDLEIERLGSACDFLMRVRNEIDGGNKKGEKV